MASLIIRNLSLKQAKVLAEWFSGQGEQDCVPWFENNDIEAPTVDCSRNPWLEVNKTEKTVTFYCKG